MFAVKMTTTKRLALEKKIVLLHCVISRAKIIRYVYFSTVYSKSSLSVVGYIAGYMVCSAMLKN